jgi:DNA adenine methylase
MRPPFPYIGGKFYLAKKIISLFPQHKLYCEPCGGAANVLLNKPPSPIEVYNDLNQEVVNFFRVLRERKEELIEKLQLTPYSRAEFICCLEPSNDPVEQARRTFVKQTQGWAGVQRLTPGRWWASHFKSLRGMPDAVSKFLSSLDNLENVAARFRTVQIECLPALEVIRRYDGEDTLFYIDPPYLPETTTGKSYDLEMTVDDHVKLAETLKKVKAKVALSGYDSDLYRELYAEWDSVVFERMTCARPKDQKKCSPRKEVVWVNFPLSKAEQQRLLLVE